jgi:anti-sigma factor RsiW
MDGAKMNCPELLRTQAWLDGELDGAAAAEAERHVESCAECKAFSADAAELSDAIRRDVSHHRAPDGLRARIRRDSTRKADRGVGASGTGQRGEPASPLSRQAS